MCRTPRRRLLWICCIALLSGCAQDGYELHWLQGRGKIDRVALSAEARLRPLDGKEAFFWEGGVSVFEITHQGSTLRFEPEETGTQPLAAFWESRAMPPRGIRPGGFYFPHLPLAVSLILIATTLIGLIHGRRRHGHALSMASSFLFALAGSFLWWLLAVVVPVPLGPWVWHGGAVLSTALWSCLVLKYLPRRDLTPAEAELLTDLRIAGSFLTSGEPLTPDQWRVIEQSTLPQRVKDRIKEATLRRDSGILKNIIDVPKDRG